MVAVGVIGGIFTAALQKGAAYAGRATMRRESISLEQVTARGSTATAAELASPAMTEAASAREALVCIIARTSVSYVKRLLCLWLPVGCLVRRETGGLKRVEPGNERRKINNECNCWPSRRVQVDYQAT